MGPPREPRRPARRSADRPLGGPACRPVVPARRRPPSRVHRPRDRSTGDRTRPRGCRGPAGLRPCRSDGERRLQRAGVQRGAARVEPHVPHGDRAGASREARSPRRAQQSTSAVHPGAQRRGRAPPGCAHVRPRRAGSASGARHDTAGATRPALVVDTRATRASAHRGRSSTPACARSSLLHVKGTFFPPPTIRVRGQKIHVSRGGTQ
jgi:hypothetical protein